MIQLYYAPRTRSFASLWALEETGAPYERVLTDITTGAQKTPDYLAINPMGKVPALKNGEVTVAESAAIIAYIAEQFPNANLAPARDAPSRGRYLQWMFFASNIEAAITQIFTKIDMPTVSAGWGSASQVFDVLDKAVETGPWLLGERFSAADIAIGSGLQFAIRGFKMVPTRPSFDRYLDACASRPAFQRADKIAAG